MSELVSEAPASARAVAPEPDLGAPFELVDALGWCRLERRAADLDGSIPLRAARACVPLLEGNAYGWQLGFTARLALRRRRGRWQLDDDARVRAARACVPYLAAHGLLHGKWPALLADGPVCAGRCFGDAIGLWTGLLIRAGASPLRIADAGNRRNRDVDVDEVIVHEQREWVPLVLELRPQHVTALTLGGEVATIAPLAALERRMAALAEHRGLGEAHLAFFDRAYFDDKREGPTKKYRALLTEPTTALAVDAAIAARAGPPAITVEPAAREHDALGPRAGSTLSRFVFRNLVPFTARDDGAHVHIEPDRDALARVATAIESVWRTTFDGLATDGHKGALWYLTKYFTPHTAGEPHFFVKPPALFATPPGWSLLIDGIHGRGYGVMRGVIHADRFHAAPAVFALERGVTIEVPAEAPLARLIPIVQRDDLREPRWHPRLPTAAQS